MNLPLHAPTVPAGLVPGGFLVRLISDMHDQVLKEHRVPPTLSADGVATIMSQDMNVVMEWIREHRRDIVWAYRYSGDTGECEEVEIFAESDLRAYEKGSGPAVPFEIGPGGLLEPDTPEEPEQPAEAGKKESSAA